MNKAIGGREWQPLTDGKKSHKATYKKRAGNRKEHVRFLFPAFKCRLEKPNIELFNR